MIGIFERFGQGEADLPFIFLTARASEEEKIESLGSGAADYLVKPFRAEDGLDSPASDAALSRLGLADAELAVARVLLTGKSDKEIADELGCTQRSVSNRVSAILRKTGSRGRADFIASAGKG